MAIATYDDLRYTARWDSDERAKLAKSAAGKNLFLSHSQADMAVAKHAVDILEQNGGRVYMDVRDAAIASAASDIEIAKRLRAAIVGMRRLVVIVTENTRTSRWIPWEMGVADGVSGAERVAVFPIRRDAAASELWAQQEYFELYARIEAVRHPPGSAPMWLVRIPNGSSSGQILPLNMWIDNSRPM